MTERPATLTILLTDDDDVAAEAVVRSLHKAGLNVPVVWAADGAQALRALRGQDPDRPVPRPRLILLDLNMPLMNGFEFLQAQRADPQLCSDVVFVLTTSDADSDRARAYQSQVAGYMVKSAVGPQFSHLAQLLGLYQHTVRLP